MLASNIAGQFSENHLSIGKKTSGEEYHCERCETKKPIHAFTAVMKKRIAMSSWKTGFLCRECQCPPCLKCGKRADDADSRSFFQSEITIIVRNVKEIISRNSARNVRVKNLS